jgi:riboflavin synthase
MFTGIITDVGQVRELIPNGGVRLVIGTSYDMAGIDLGASISCSGCCLTVVEAGTDWFAVEVSAETLSCTTLGSWRAGTAINLERALKAGDELGGHIVSGHVDGICILASRKLDGVSLCLEFEVSRSINRLIAQKGSVTIDGVSLTVNSVDEKRLSVNIIPHTQAVTTFGGLEPGSAVNLEIDMLARYVARLLVDKI